ncbi:MAG TPA: hypothetical protein IGR64_15050 [Leptolyngbyaceae cyanobacterium M65_K2018_010]|nr:hypothetical protein [Leptolyngbyaceae cyanobacterium M65_K2018_010]
MRTYKSQKIDQNADYPCPCRRNGRIKPITLTEAFGCDRCQQIFVVQEDGYVIEQLSSHYPYKRAWRWTGHQWKLDRSALSISYLPLLVMASFGLMVFFLLIATFQSPQGTQTVTRFLTTLAVFSLLVGMFWLASRR